MSNKEIVRKLWSLGDGLRDDGISYYVAYFIVDKGLSEFRDWYVRCGIYSACGLRRD